MATPRAPLPIRELRSSCDPKRWTFESTAELEPLSEPLGQENALSAVRLAIEMEHSGDNLFAVGPGGLGKHAAVLALLEAAAKSRAAPSDWCYVHDFAQPEKPRAFRLAAGRGRVFRDDMRRLVQELRTAIPAAFETDAYRIRVQEIEERSKQRAEAVFQKIEEEAARQDVGMARLPDGVAFAPLRGGQVMAPDEFERLPEDERERIKQRVAALQEQLARDAALLPRLRKEMRDQLRDLNREVTQLAVAHAIAEIERAWRDFPQILGYLADVRVHVIENADDFRKSEDNMPGFLSEVAGARAFARYQVNLLVDHADTGGAPVIYEDRPTVDQLLGRIDHRAELGNLVSDFTLIRAGALHRANGGFLVLDLRSVLSKPNAWEALKRALFSREIGIESLAQMMGVSSTATLEPQPIPLDVKVALIGDRTLYHLINELDPDVAELFLLVADFEEEVDRTPESELAFVRAVAGIVQRDALLPVDRAAAARLVEQSARWAGDAHKLSTRIRWLADLVREADHAARAALRESITTADVIAAIQAREKRSSRPRRHLLESVLRNVVLIDTTGAKVGQANGLSVLEFGGFRFGQPARITATARVGDGRVIDIEREVELGGPLHSKGVLILSSWLAARYARDLPLSLSATLVFEQSYAGVEGDSGSLAELCALLSALSDIGIKQSIAVTGSVNQLGQVQAIGGVNEKIEGFFELCNARGLDGKQGVVIPRANVENLMLAPEVVEAAANGRFRIWPVATIDEANEILTGVSAGVADEAGEFPPGTINRLVLDTLREFAVIAESFERLVQIEARPTAAEPRAK